MKMFIYISWIAYLKITPYFIFYLVFELIIYIYSLSNIIR